MINSVEKTLCTLLFFFIAVWQLVLKFVLVKFVKEISTYCLETMTLFLCAFHAGSNRYK